jgi:four helix bundle protein
MFLNLEHTKLDVYRHTQLLSLECYKVTGSFPADERFSMIQQLRRAALSVHLNLAEGCSRRSHAERKRFFEISRGSIIEIDACLDLAVKLKYTSREDLDDFGQAMLKTFQMLSKMINRKDPGYVI